MQLFKDIVSIFTPLVAAIIAWRGLSTWRRQLHVTRDSDLAKRLLVSLYRAEAAIDDIRVPFSTITILKEEASDPKALEKARAKMYETKWKHLADILAEFQAGIIEAKAIWDKQFPEIARPFYVCVHELNDHINDYLQRKLDDDHVPLYEEKESRAVLFAKLGASSKKDEFRNQLTTGIEAIDDAVRVRLATGR